MKEEKSPKQNVNIEDILPKKNTKKRVIIMVLMVIAIGIGLYFGYREITLNPFNVYKRAINETYDFASNYVLENFKDIIDIDLAKDPFNIKTSFKLDTNMEELSILKDYDYTIAIGTDAKKEQLDMSLGMNKGNENALDLLFAFLNNRVYLKSESLYPEILDLGEVELDFDSLQLDNSFYDYEDLLVVLNETKPILVNTIKKDNLSLDNEEITVNDKKIKAKKFTYELKKEEIKESIEYIRNEFLNNYELLEALSHITGLTINELEEALKEETNASYENMLINLYTNGGTKVIAGNIKVNDEEIIRFTNDEEIFNLELIDDFASISIVYENNTLECIYEELNTILFTTVIKQTDDSEQISITVNDDTKIYKIDIKLSNMKTTKDTLSLDYTLDYNMNDEVTLKLDGTLEITKEELTDISSSTNLDDLTEEELQLFYENFMSILDKFNLTDYLI